MKKTAMVIAAAALACTVGATGVWAAGAGRAHGNRTCTTAQCLFTDTDGDGVCDYAADGTCRYDTDGDGVCDYAADGTCRYDTDGDGVCDYAADGTCRYDADGDGVCDHGYCFTDENGDGICDNRTTGGCQGGGHGCHGRACQP